MQEMALEMDSDGMQQQDALLMAQGMFDNCLEEGKYVKVKYLATHSLVPLGT